MSGIEGKTLRQWRRSFGWDVPKTARELRRLASEPVAAPDALVRMIRGWERGDHELSERYSCSTAASAWSRHSRASANLRRIMPRMTSKT